MATPGPDERFDELLLNIAGQCGGIEPLFDTVFSFLLRKTDYFHVMQPGDNIGFKQGVAQQILLRSFSKFESAAASATKRAELEKAKAKKKPPPKPPAAAEKKPVSAPAPEPASSAAAAPATAARDELGSSMVGTTQDGNEVVGKQKATHLQEHVEHAPYNGGRTDKYYWEQTLVDVTINAPVPKGTRARDIVCVISKNHLTLKLKGQEPLIDADYPCDARNGKEIWEKVKVSECYWNVGEAKGEQCVTIYLEKEREAWWKSAVDGGIEIDTTQVDSSRDVYDYDDETQGAIRKIMFDQHQKRLGKPTSDEMKNEDMLKQAWNAEGSPFAGQPFDPSRVNFNGSSDYGGGAGSGAPGMMPLEPPEPPVDITPE